MAKTTLFDLRKTAKLFGYLGIITGVVLFIMFGVLKWPGLHHDSVLYATPIINLATGNGWRFDSYAFTFINRPSDEYSFHGVLYPIIFGLLLKISNYENLLLWSSIFNAIAFIVYTFLFYRALTTKFPVWGLLIATIFGAMAGLISQELQGRPEHLAPLLIAIPLLMREFNITREYFRYYCYIIAGLLFILSPLPAAIYGMGLIFWLSLYHRKKLWKELLLAGIISLGSSGLIITVFCSFSPLTWLNNVFFAGNSPLLPTDFWRLTTTDISLTSTYPAYNFFVIIVVLLVVKTLLQRKLFVILIIWLLLGFYLMPKVQPYGYTPFFPLLLLMICGKEQNWITQNEKIKNWITYIGTGFTGIYFLVLIRLTIMLIIYWQQGTSFVQAKVNLQQFSEKLNPSNERIGYYWLNRPSFIAFGSVNQPLISVESGVLMENNEDTILTTYEKKFNKKIVYIIIPQLGHISNLPETINNSQFKLVYNGWTNKRAKFMGIKLGGAVPGYQFALYKRVK